MSLLLKKIMNVRWHSALIVLVMCTIALFAYIRISELLIADPKPQILPILPKKQAGLAGVVARVRSGLFIKNFSLFDALNNKFVIDATAWFLFNPTEVTLATIGKFSFLKGRFLKKSPPDTRIMGKKLLVRYDITVEFSTSLDQRFFPFDDHRVALVLINEFVTIDELMYRSVESAFTTVPNIDTGGYALEDKGTDVGYALSQLEEYQKIANISHPVVAFSLDFHKPGIRKALLIILPVLLIYFISVFAFAFVRSATLIRIFFGAVTALLAYRFVIETLSPKIGYFSLTDYFYFFSLGVVFILFLMGIYFSQTEKASSAEKLIRATSVLVAYPALVVLFYYLFFLWGRG